VSIVGGVDIATEWSGGNVINLGGLPGSTSSGPIAVNDSGQAVDFSLGGGVISATEWSEGNVIDLGGFPGFTASEAFNINDMGQAVGLRDGTPVPEASTWAMMLAGFAGLAFAGYRRAKAGPIFNSDSVANREN
jgi:hypothetical protein